jgi:hypothetical protein
MTDKKQEKSLDEKDEKSEKSEKSENEKKEEEKNVDEKVDEKKEEKIEKQEEKNVDEKPETCDKDDVCEKKRPDVCKTLHERFLCLQKGGNPEDITGVKRLEEASRSEEHKAFLGYMKAEIDKVTSEVKSYSDEIKVHKSQIETHAKSLDVHKSTLNNSDKQMDDIHKKINEINDSLHEIKESCGKVSPFPTDVVESFEQKLSAMNANIVSLVTDTNTGLISVDKKAKVVEEYMVKQLDDFREEVDGKISKAEERSKCMVENIAEIREISDIVRKNSDEIIEQKNVEANLEKRLKISEDDACDLDKKVSNIDIHVGECEAKIRTLPEIVETLERVEKDVASLNISSVEQTAVLTHVDDTVQRLEEEVDSMSTEIKTINISLGTHKCEIKRLDEVVAGFRESNERITRHMLEVDKTMVQMRESMHELTITVNKFIENKLKLFDDSLSTIRDQFSKISREAGSGLVITGDQVYISDDTSTENQGILPLSSSICYSKLQGNKIQSFKLPTTKIDGFCLTFYVTASPGMGVYIYDPDHLKTPTGDRVFVKNGGSVTLVHTADKGWHTMSLNNSRFHQTYIEPSVDGIDKGFVHMSE